MIIQTRSLILGVIGNNGSNCLNNCNKIIIFVRFLRRVGVTPSFSLKGNSLITEVA